MCRHYCLPIKFGLTLNTKVHIPPHTQRANKLGAFGAHLCKLPQNFTTRLTSKGAAAVNHCEAGLTEQIMCFFCVAHP